MNRSRMTGAIALLAIGTFTIVITGANRRSFYGSENDRNSGTGGFLFWSESTIPVLYDLNTQFGRKQFLMDEEPLFNHVKFMQMLKVEGDDASCLNLNQVSQPVMLGVNSRLLDSVSAFSFQQLDHLVDPLHPWKILQHSLSVGVIPAFADQTVIQWGLGKSVGDTLIYKDESGRILKVKLMGGMDNSVFEGNLLISDSLLRVFYPSKSGSKLMLVNGPAEKQKEIFNTLETTFQDFGMMITPTSERLALFNSVQNTYLSVFMMLGGLGVIIGTFGLGFFILRNIMTRQVEIATYTALGFQRRFILRLMVTEFLIILVSGMAIGIVSALVAILPSFFSPAFQLPGIFLLIILMIVFISGLLWIVIPIRVFMKQNLVGVLKRE